MATKSIEVTVQDGADDEDVCIINIVPSRQLEMVVKKGGPKSQVKFSQFVDEDPSEDKYSYTWTKNNKKCKRPASMTIETSPTFNDDSNYDSLDYIYI